MWERVKERSDKKNGRKKKFSQHVLCSEEQNDEMHMTKNAFVGASQYLASNIFYKKNQKF